MRFIPLITFVAFGCSPVSGPELAEGEYLVRVDELEVPTSVQADETLHMVARGRVGPNLCHMLDRVEAVRRRDRLELTFVGRDRSAPGILCAQAVSPLYWEASTHPPFHRPMFTVVVSQPDGSELTREVAVN